MKNHAVGGTQISPGSGKYKRNVVPRPSEHERDKDPVCTARVIFSAALEMTTGTVHFEAHKNSPLFLAYSSRIGCQEKSTGRDRAQQCQHEPLQTLAPEV